MNGKHFNCHLKRLKTVSLFHLHLMWLLSKKVQNCSKDLPEFWKLYCTAYHTRKPTFFWILVEIYFCTLHFLWFVSHTKKKLKQNRTEA